MTEEGRRLFNIILALLVSVAAWTFVVYNYDPMTKETYLDVPITYTGLDSLANRGYAVSESSDDSVQVTLQQRRIDTGNITRDDISVTADVSALDGGENTVALRISGPDGTQVSDASLKTVSVYIERASGAEFEISVEYPDNAEDDAEPVVTDMSEVTADVITSEEKLAEIDKVAVIIDPEDLDENLKPLTFELAAYNKDGEQVLNVIIDPKTVSFKAAAAYTKEVPLIVPVKDGSDDSYARTVTAPETIVVKGSREAIENISGITADEINVSYYYEDYEVPVTISFPEGIYPAKGYEDLVAEIKVTEAKKTKEKKDKNE